ncbi:hypothetical protein [Microbacterium sp. NPDC076911]|uniref:hypothetical protein n=1 Tax=Microbacterium sp. NPDC076911 TaxID=3154958 RepID=UPI0034375F35
MTRRDMPLLWTQGLRPEDPKGVHSMSRHEVLWRRLTGQFEQLKSGYVTGSSEAVLGIGRNCYYYVGYTDPAFNVDIVVFSNHRPDGDAHTRVSPFDTGGIATNKASFASPMTKNDRIALVVKNSFAVGRYQASLETWLSSGFTSPNGYTHKEVPHTAFDPAIDISASKDERDWRWEGRVAAIDFVDVPLEPVAVFFAKPGMLAYIDWVTYDLSWPAGEKKAHLDRIRSIGRDVLGPEASAQQLIQGVP